jgi:hypothetical protein
MALVRICDSRRTGAVCGKPAFLSVVYDPGQPPLDVCREDTGWPVELAHSMVSDGVTASREPFTVQFTWIGP